MNFMDVAVGDDVLHHDVFSLPISDPFSSTLDGWDQVTIGIRPKDIEIDREDGEGFIDDRTEAVIDVVEPMGELSHVYLSVDGLDLTATVDGERRFDEGDAVAIRFPEEKLHCFDPETGAALRTRSLPDEKAASDDETRSSGEVAT